MNLLWSSHDFVEAISGRPVGEMPQGVTGVSIDTRTLKPGEAFFAIKGENFDGHSFCTAALAHGAGMLVVAESKLPSLGRLKAPMVVVDDVLVALERLAAAARARTRAQVIAVTGSVGKTTTKEALRHLLAPSGSVHASERSFNNHWGVPLTLARLPKDADFGVFEIGMNHPGEIRPLVKLVKPHVAIITMVAPAHLGNFVSVEEIAHAKAEIFEGLVPGGYAVLNRDDERFRLLESLAHAAGVDHFHGFGEHARANTRLLEIFPEGNGSRLKVRIGSRNYSGYLALPGRHIAQNMLAALGACYLAGADMEQAVAAMATLPAAPGRGERINLRHPKGGRFLLIDESYNANPASMRAAIRLLADTNVGSKGRRIAVLGDMLEMGDHAQVLHGELAEPLLEAGIDKVFLAGPEMKALQARLPKGYPAVHGETAEAIKGALFDAVRPGDAIVVKASNGIGFSKLVTAMKEAFPQEGTKEKAAEEAAGV
jgi:UDP-N-acetylmuramoyl-tripeptide--D-alanyl-D-alanine ligase